MFPTPLSKFSKLNCFNLSVNKLVGGICILFEVSIHVNSDV